MAGPYITFRHVQLAPGPLCNPDIPLVAPLACDHAFGEPVSEANTIGISGAAFVSVFDKTGFRLGVLSTINIATSPSRSVINAGNGSGGGNATLTVARNEDDVDLLTGDHIVLIGDPKGQPWAGLITVQEWGGSQLQVQAGDIFELLDRQLTMKIDGAEGTTAYALIAAIVAAINAQREEDGEMPWEVEAVSPSTHTYIGDFDHEGTELEAIKLVVDRAMVEVTWRVEVRGGQLVPIIRVCDRFATTSPVILRDGPLGNIIGEPRYRRDPSTYRSSITLVGAPTDIASLTPDWARWAVHEIEPTVIVASDPVPGLRQRNDEEVSVDWSLSRAEQQVLADMTADAVKQMYYSFLRAVHDQYGRPFHEGWVYTGPPDNLAKTLYRKRWVTDLRLIEDLSGNPLSQVMRSGPMSSDNLRQRLVVAYNRVTAEQTVTARAEALVDTGLRYSLVVPAGTTKILYRISNGRANQTGESLGGPVTLIVGPVLQMREALLPNPTYLYGGKLWERGIKMRVRDRVRTTPYVKSTNIVGYKAKDTVPFIARQITVEGTSVGGSKKWYGNSSGNRWVHASSVVIDGWTLGPLRSFRRITTGDHNGFWVVG